MTKVCVKCGSSEFSDRGDCRPCKREYDKVYRAENKAKVAAAKKKAYEAKSDYYIQKSRSYYVENKEAVAASNVIYRTENKAVISERKRIYRQSNTEKLSKKSKEYYEKNKEYVNARQKEYCDRNKDAVMARRAAAYAKNSDAAKARAKAWTAANSDRSKETRAKYFKENPEVYHNLRVKRRALYKGKGLSKGVISLLLEEQGCKCPGCLKTLGDNFHLDHVNPLSKGGEHCDNNIQLLCPRCNLTKHATDAQEWIASIAQKPTVTSMI